VVWLCLQNALSFKQVLLDMEEAISKMVIPTTGPGLVKVGASHPALGTRRHLPQRAWEDNSLGCFGIALERTSLLPLCPGALCSS
jgi:hypothetical protein